MYSNETSLPKFEAQNLRLQERNLCFQLLKSDKKGEGEGLNWKHNSTIYSKVIFSVLRTTLEGFSDDL